MDLKSVLSSGEDSLPTLQGNLALSTSTAAPGLLPQMKTDPLAYWKFGASGIMGLLGMVYLAQGKKNADFGKMALGAALTVGSMFLF